MRTQTTTLCICERCGAEFPVLLSRVRRRGAKFCTLACFRKRENRYKINRAFVIEVNARTVCVHCGAQPIEWHNAEHVELNRQAYRIHNLVSSGCSIAEIQAEMDRCIPLCRRCHMAEDGRLAAFAARAKAKNGIIIKPPSPCTNCSRLYKPLRKGLCNACYWHLRNTPRRLTPGYVLGKHSPYKLTGQKVAEIRRFYQRGHATKRELSRLYAVSYSTVHRIIIEERWAS